MNTKLKLASFFAFVRYLETTEPLRNYIMTEFVDEREEGAAALMSSEGDDVAVNGTTKRKRWHIFLSYRRASDALHAQLLYESLTARGYTVWWDSKCLKSGIPFEASLCEGYLNSRAFVFVLSKEGINHPDITWQNFGKLAKDSRCDHLFLEHRLLS